MSDENKEDQKEEQVDVMKELKELKELTDKLQEDNKKLKEFADLTIKEKKDKAAKDKAEKERLEQEILNAKASTKEEAENIAKQWKERAEASEKKLEENRKKEYQRNLQDKALQLAQTKAAKDPNRAKVLADILIKNMKLDDDGNVVVTDDKGNATISPVDDLVNRVAENYKFLVDGLDSSGGGMHNSVSTPKKSFKDMTVDERTELYNKSPEEYEQAKAQG